MKACHAFNLALPSLLIARSCWRRLSLFFEEKYLVQYRAPVLLAVGLEGFWGVSLCCLALPLLQHVRGPDGLPLDNLQQAIAVSQCSCGDVAGGAC